MTDELMHRLQAIDPAPPHVPITPADSPAALLLKEHIMNSPHPTNPSEITAGRQATQPRSRRRWLAGGIGGVAVAGAGALALSLGGGSPTAATSINLTAGAFDPMSSCMPVADQQPVPGTIAFGGKVISIDGDQVTIDVDRWYAAGPDGEVDQVVIDGDSAGSPALDGVEFTDGQDVLVSASDGVVGGCGISGSRSPELEQFFEQWYGQP